MVPVTTTTSSKYTVGYDPYVAEYRVRYEYLLEGDPERLSTGGHSHLVRQSELAADEIRIAKEKPGTRHPVKSFVAELRPLEPAVRKDWVVRYEGTNSGDVYETEKKAQKRVQELTKDAALVAAYGPRAIESLSLAYNHAEPSPTSLPGDRVKIYSRGKERPGVVTEVTKTRVRVLYTTPSNVGFFTHKWFPKVGV